MEKQKLTEQEIQQITNHQTKSQDVIYRLGQNELANIGIQKMKGDLREEIANLENEEKLIAQQIQTKYGEGSIDLNSGEFIPHVKG